MILHGAKRKKDIDKRRAEGEKSETVFSFLQREERMGTCVCESEGKIVRNIIYRSS